MLEYLGRFHPLVIHLPIGVLVLSYLLEAYSSYKKVPEKQVQSFVLLIAAFSATLSVITGLLLVRGGYYSGDLVLNHKYLAIGLGAICWALYFLSRSNARKAYLITLLSSAVMLGITGHLGGSLTHGEDFLFKSNTPSVRPNLEEALLYNDVIQPIFEDKCVSCHNPRKLKGSLNMESHAELLKGGEHGKIVIPTDPVNSEIGKRMNLPLQDKEHMPPSGKKQLSKDEVTMINWWIESGAEKDKKVKDLEAYAKYKDIVAKFLAPPSVNIFDKVEKPDSIVLRRLKNKGFKLYPLSAGSSAVYVSFLNKKDLSRRDFSSLRKIKNNVAKINLGGSGSTDKMMSELNRFKHLEKLELQNTMISAKGINQMVDFDFLHTLNIYNTKVDSQAISTILSFPQLRKLYCWKSEITPAQIQSMRLARPRLDIVYEVGGNLFEDAKLRSPLINADTDIFDDSLEVSLDLNFQGVDIYYTTDGSMPDSSSTLYKKAFKIGETTTVKTFADKETWYASPISERSFVKTGKRIEEIKLHNQPQDNYKSFAKNTLINNKLGSKVFSDGEWVGYEGKHARVTLMLDRSSEIESVTVGVLEATGSYIFFPAAVIISTSEGGKKFDEVARLTMPIADAPTETRRKNMILEFKKHKARWVKVDVISHLKNPPWHPAPGAKNWVFIDEFLVN